MNYEDIYVFFEGFWVEFSFGDMVIVVCFFVKFFGFGGKDGWCVSFGNGEGDEDLDNEREDELNLIELFLVSSIR